MLVLLKNTYHLLSIITILVSIVFLRNKYTTNKLDSIIIYTIIIFNFFDLFFLLLPKNEISIQIGVFAYDILFPLYILSIVLLKKHRFVATVLVIALSITGQYLLKYSLPLPKAAHFKIALSLIACIMILIVVFKTIHRARMQVFLLLLLAGITFMDMFFNAAMFKIIPFDMHIWIIFLSSYIFYLCIISSIFIYYYGRQLFKH